MENPFDNWEERAKNLPTLRFEAVDGDVPTAKLDLSQKTAPFIGIPGDAVPVDPSDVENNFYRYVDFDELGMGGTGVVSSCLDPHLNRVVALKVLRYEYSKDMDQRTRFVREARVMAQLEHPNILPIHELGVRPDGVIYYSMKRVNGKTLREVLDGLAVGDPTLTRAYPIEQLLDVFQHICHAMAFAHSRGVLHRDLKPENVLIGPFGEVLVMDWGLAKLLDEEDIRIKRKSTEELNRKLNVNCGTTTLDGDISGTPLYMSPEQAAGKVMDMDQRTDVYSLGVILYEILTLERPIDGSGLTEILTKVVKGEVTPPRRSGCGRDVPRELDAICMKAMATRPSDRYADLPSLIADLENYEAGHEVSAYEDGLGRKAWKWCKRHPVFSSTTAVALLALATALGGTRLNMHARRAELLMNGDKELAEAAAVQKNLLVELKTLNDILRDATSKRVSEEEDEQRKLVDEMEAKLMSHLQYANYLFTKARLQVPGRAPERLISLNRLRVEYLLAKKDFAALGRHMDYVRERLLPLLPPDDPNREIVEGLVKKAEGVGKLTADTVPDNQYVSLWEYQPDDSGVLKPVFLKALGSAPVSLDAIAKGSYLLVTSKTDPGFETTSTLPTIPKDGMTYCPVKIDHAENESVTIYSPGRVPDGMVYVAPGKAYLGGVHSRELRLHQKDVAGFFIKRQEVSFSDYLAFWLASDGGNRQSEYMARVRFARDSYRYEDAWDADGNLLDGLSLERPVVGISQASAVAYCKWLSRKRGRTVRLPTATEWEKAARGVDGRPMVWGASLATDLCFTLENKDARKIHRNWAPPGSFPTDVSVYGVQDMAGNVREWTASTFENSPYFQIKGGSASLTQRFTYCAYASDTPVVPSDVGFRYVMPVKK